MSNAYFQTYRRLTCNIYIKSNSPYHSKTERSKNSDWISISFKKKQNHLAFSRNLSLKSHIGKYPVKETLMIFSVNDSNDRSINQGRWLLNTQSHQVILYTTLWIYFSPRYAAPTTKPTTLQIKRKPSGKFVSYAHCCYALILLKNRSSSCAHQCSLNSPERDRVKLGATTGLRNLHSNPSCLWW